MKALVAYLSGQIAVVPDSAMVRCREPFFLPDDRPWKAIPLMGVRIDRLGKGIATEYANRYYNECLTAVHPFALSESEDCASRWSRDGALILSETVSSETLNADLRCRINRMISAVSSYATLKTGDLILIADTDRMFNLNSESCNYMVEPHLGLPGMKLKVR